MIRHIRRLLAKVTAPSLTGRAGGGSVLLLLAALLPMSCVLTMEDYTLIPEEERGVGQPYTYEDSLVTCTYQYREGVVPITERWLPYVLGSQDSTVYISDNIPEDWLPKPGECVSAGCTRTFPYGLCHRVLSMERGNGMIAMNLTDATVDDVFKELDIELNMDNYEVPEMDLSEDSTDNPSYVPRVTRGGVEDPHIVILSDGSIMDFTYVDAAQASPEHKYLKPRTRDGSFDDGDHSINDTTREYNKVHWQFTFNHEDGIELGKSSGFAIKPSFEFNLDKNIVINAHKESWKSKEESVEWSEKYVTSTYQLRGKVSAEYNPLEREKNRNKISQKEWRILSAMAKKVRQGLNNRTRLHSFDPRNLYISFPPPIPAAIRIHLGVNLSVSFGGFSDLIYKDVEKVERVTTKRKGNTAVQTSELIREATRTSSGLFGGAAEGTIEGRIGIGFLIGKLGTGVGLDVGGGLEVKVTFDCLTDAIGKDDNPVDTIYNKSGFHFSVTGFIDFEIFADFKGEPYISTRVAPEDLRWTLKETNWYIFPQVDNRASTGIYKYDYSDKDNPVVHHSRKLSFRSGYGFSAFNDIVYPLLMVYENDLKTSVPKQLAPRSYTGKQAKKDNLYPLEPKEVYYFDYDSDPRKAQTIWFVPALKHADGSIDEYRSLVTKWGSSSVLDEPIMKHIELYQYSSNEKDDTKHLFDKDWDFYHIEDILEITSVPQEYLKVGYIIDVVDAKNRNVIKKSDVYVMGHTLQSTGTQVVKPGIYKVYFDIGIPSDGRGPVTHPLVPSVKAYPILTVQPYYEFYDVGEGKYKKVTCKEKCISLKFPYTTDYSYKKANFTTEISQPVRQ